MPPKRKAALVATDALTTTSKTVGKTTAKTVGKTTAKTTGKTTTVTVTVKPAKKAKAEEEASPNTCTKVGKGLRVGNVFAAQGLEVVREDGETVPLASIFASSGAVLFFYPRANTPGCTNQACGFRDQFQVFQKKGYAVYGMSADSPVSQASWKAKYQLPYSLLSDRTKDRAVLKALGVNKAPSSVLRSHLVFAKGGAVEQVCYGVSPKESVAGALEFVQQSL